MIYRHKIVLFTYFYLEQSMLGNKKLLNLVHSHKSCKVINLFSITALTLIMNFYKINKNLKRDSFCFCIFYTCMCNIMILNITMFVFKMNIFEIFTFMISVYQIFYLNKVRLKNVVFLLESIYVYCLCLVFLYIQCWCHQYSFL